MRVSDKAIILQNIRYGDKKHILKIYTKHHGSLTVAASIGKSSSKIKSGAVMPLTLADVELTIKQNKDIHLLTEASCYCINAITPTSLHKLSIAQFLNEVLLKTLKEQASNLHLFEFIETCLKFLNDSEEDYMNLHLYFLGELTKYLGFEPQNDFSAWKPYFDCREGRFSGMALTMPLGLNAQESLVFSEFLKTNGLKAQLSNLQRQMILEAFLAYYKLHVPGFNDIKSLEVLKEVVR